tara:strand:+ start:5982 stop:6908 length:927 start_codon:yes stop_codon:yes gene_type:complete
MSYKYSKGPTVQGDIAARPDVQRDTKINFEEDYIALEASGSAVLVVSGSKVGVGLTNPSHKFDVNGDIRVRGNDIRDNSGNPAISFDGSANTTIVNNLTVQNYTFPASDGNADQVLQTNGSGQLSFVDVDGGGGGGGGGSGGKVLQVIHTAFTASTEINATTFATISGFEATITPSATSSKILIHIHANVGLDGIGTDRYGVIKVFRSVSGNSNFVMGGKGPLSGQQDDMVFNTISTDPTTTHERNLVYSATGLDSPNTTNAITYQVRARVNANGTPVMAINRTTANPANLFHSPAASSITLMEIDGS